MINLIYFTLNYLIIEDISSKFPKEEKIIKNEIITIKNELLKLNHRFEEKLK